MLNPAALQLAAELGGTLLRAEGGSLLLVERIRAHGLPHVAVLGRDAADLHAPLAAAARAQARGVELNLLALLPLPGCDLAAALASNQRRLGALVAALDAGLPWLSDQPMLVRRLPGRVFRTAPVPLPKAPMGPLEKAELKLLLANWGSDPAAAHAGDRRLPGAHHRLGRSLDRAGGPARPGPLLRPLLTQ